MNWNDAKQNPPKPENSPIIACGKDLADEDYCAVLTWIKKDRARWLPPGWYEWLGIRGYTLKMEEVKWWAPLPMPPKENNG